MAGRAPGLLVEAKGDWQVAARTTFVPAARIAVPAGTFTNVLEFRTLIDGARCDSPAASAFVNGTRYLWFAKGVGLVRMRYEHSNGNVTEAALLSYSLAGQEDQYLPLQTGNRWTYAWKNALRQLAVIETWRLGEEPESFDHTPPRQTGAPELKAVDPRTFTLDPSQDHWVKIAENPQQGYQFPFYLFIPRGIALGAERHLFVEPNNTGTTSDDFRVHEEAAARLVRSSYATRIAQGLGTPLLVPVFPRPAGQWQAYTHSLDGDTLLIASGPLQRIDLQLIAMIREAQALLRRNHVNVRDRVFMHGFSASGVFANRFAVLHPRIVRAVASGGLNAIPLFPTRQWHGVTLPFPVGIADLQQIAQIEFDERAYQQVSQYLYMGYLDRNDTTLSRDAFCEDHARLIREVIGAEMPKRWAVSQSIYRELGVSAQCVTYNGTSHEIKPEMLEDIIRFFRANANGEFVPIAPHEYPFVEYREIQTAHINGLYWQGDPRIPEGIRNLFGDKNSFIISIQEWMEGQDHRQLNVFEEKAGFCFRLKAPGRPDILITKQHLRGNCSTGRGQFQGFVVGLPASEIAKIAPGAGYTIEPTDQNGEYRWQVNPDVILTR